MVPFLLVIFCSTFIAYGIIAFLKGTLVLSFLVFFNLTKAQGASARLLSIFIVIFFVACIYFWIPQNKIISDSVLISNIIAIGIGVIIGLKFYSKTMGIHVAAHNKAWDIFWTGTNFWCLMVLALVALIWWIFFPSATRTQITPTIAEKSAKSQAMENVTEEQANGIADQAFMDSHLLVDAEDLGAITRETKLVNGIWYVDMTFTPFDPKSSKMLFHVKIDEKSGKVLQFDSE